MLRSALELPPLAPGGRGGGDDSRWASEAALAAERAGIGALWLVESLPDGLDPVPIAGALAASTSTIGVGVRFRPGYGRHPSLIVRDLVTLDLLSGGRALVGLVEEGSGPLDLERLGEAVALTRRLLAETEVTEAGRFYEVAELTVRPRPIPPGPPVVAGVLSEPPGPGSAEDVIAHAGASALVVTGGPGELVAARERLDAVAPAGERPGLLWRGPLPEEPGAAFDALEAVFGAGADGVIAVVRDDDARPRGPMDTLLEVVGRFAGA